MFNNDIFIQVTCLLQNFYDSLLSCPLTSECLDTIDRIGLSPRRRERRPDLKDCHEVHFIGLPWSSSSRDLSSATINALNLSISTTDSDFNDVTSPITTEMSEELMLAIHSTVGHMFDLTGTTDTSCVFSDVTVR